MRERWTPEQAHVWHTAQPWLVGCNYIPSSACNQLEMWQPETFDIEVNRRELGWAGDTGFNTVRAFLHDLLWEQDPDGFLVRVDTFLRVCDGLGIRPLFVLFDGVWNPHPRPGPQPEPRPRVHNAGWVQSPGVDKLSDPETWDGLEEYVRGVIARFRDDERVLGWDLFNEPDNPNMAYAKEETARKAELTAELLGKAFAWAREVDPSQPITAGLWTGRWDHIDEMSDVNRIMVSESDVISFHSYVPAPNLAKRINILSQFDRPLLLTEYLARPLGSTFEEVLPLLKERNVGAFNWGFVAGRTQTIYPWDSWEKRYEAEPIPWFHDVLREDGTPYRRQEVDLIRGLTRR